MDMGTAEKGLTTKEKALFNEPVNSFHEILFPENICPGVDRIAKNRYNTESYVFPGEHYDKTGAK